MRDDGISFSPASSSSRSMRSTACSSSSTGTGRLVQAFLQAAQDLHAVERLAPAVLLDHQRQHLVDALVGREAAAAADALAPAADDLSLSDGRVSTTLSSMGSRRGSAWCGCRGYARLPLMNELRSRSTASCATAAPGPPWPACCDRWASTRRASRSSATGRGPARDLGRGRPGRRRQDRDRRLHGRRLGRRLGAARTRPASDDDALVLGGRKFKSRLLIGTGKYRTLEEGREAILRFGRRNRHRGAPPGRPDARQAQRPRHHRSHAPHASSPTPPAATPPRRPSAPAGWRASWGSPTW